MELLIAWAIGAVIMGLFGSWVAGQKRRSPSEGMGLGLLFGPLGVLIEALLPTGTEKQGAVGRSAMNIDDQGTLAYIVDRYRSYLHDNGMDWHQISPHRRRTALATLDKQLQKELKMTSTEFSGYASRARRSDLGDVSK